MDYLKNQFPNFSKAMGDLPKAERHAIEPVFQFLAYCQSRLSPDGTGVNLASDSLYLVSLIHGGFQEPQWQALRNVVEEKNLPKSLFLEYLDGLNLMLLRRTFRDETHLKQYLRFAGETPARLFALAVGEVEVAAQKDFAIVARGWERGRTVLDLGVDLQEGRCFLTQFEQEDFELSPEKAAEGELDDGMARLLTERVATSLEELSHATALLPLVQNTKLRQWVEHLLNVQVAALEDVARDPKKALKKQEATTLFSRLIGFFQKPQI